MRELVLVVLAGFVCGVWGHGRLYEPPSRSTTWRRGYDTPKNYNDNELFCGGFGRQQRNGGKCGFCGDPWDGARENEAGGRYARGVISKRYSVGQVIEVTVQITANHKGWFEFNMCPVNDPNVRVTQACLDRYPLQLADGSGARWQLSSTRTGPFTLHLRLPPGLQCTQCVLQWRYWTGNSWGTDPDTGRGCVGCGPQEQFRGCADVAIGDGTLPPTQPPPSTNPPTVPTGPPSTSPPEATPSPWPTRIEGVRCRAIGSWEGNPQMDAWCERNCNHFPPFCPQERCWCWMEP